MQMFRIKEDDQGQFAEAPEVAMDLNFAQSNFSFYLVISCRMAILLNESTFTEPEGDYFQQSKVWTNISVEERTANFMQWFNELPVLETVETAAPAQAWQSFWGAMNAVSPVGPLPPSPPRPPSIYGHLPFKATTLPDTVIYRWEAYPTSKRINRTTIPPSIAKDTYAAPASEIPFVPTGFGAVARFALPNLMPACYRYELQPMAGTPIECGAVVPLYGQSGGGVEVKFTNFTKNRCAIADPLVLPAL